MTLAIRLSAVGKDYPHFILNDIDLAVPEGQVMGLIGPNGAGKSTTLRILMGLVHQDRGHAEVLGHAMPAEQTIAKRDVGFVSEDMRLYKSATLAWHMAFIASIYPEWDAKYADLLVKRFGLRKDQKVGRLSHGERVKATLLLVLARRPRLMVLDEPTTGLDPVARHEVLASLMEALLDEHRTILFSSHNTTDVEQISDQITFIDRGHIVESGDKERFLDRWRRVRLEIEPGMALPALPDVVSTVGSGRLSIVTTSNYDDAMSDAWRNAGARVFAVEPMTLEEIFVARVINSRAPEAA
jgi:ABC-2 type transport system ATP-binding protein